MDGDGQVSHHLGGLHQVARVEGTLPQSVSSPGARDADQVGEASQIPPELIDTLEEDDDGPGQL